MPDSKACLFRLTTKSNQNGEDAYDKTALLASNALYDVRASQFFVGITSSDVLIGDSLVEDKTSMETFLGL